MESALKEYWTSYSKQLTRTLTSRYADPAELDNLELLRSKVCLSLNEIRSEMPELAKLEQINHSLSRLGDLSRSAMSEGETRQMEEILRQLNGEVEGVAERIIRHGAFTERMAARQRKVWLQKIFLIPALILILTTALTYLGIRLYLAR